MLSQTLALLASNVLIYLETVLLSAKFIPVEAMIVLTFIDVGVILVWTLVVNWIFRKRTFCCLYVISPDWWLREM